MKIELCAATLDGVKLAKKLDFDRIELCQNLEQGGMTPSPGFIEYALALGVETHVLIRPRPGGFHYGVDELEIILRDIRECKDLGAQGVVVGALNERGLIDEFEVSKMVDVAGDMDVTFHRAFDDLYDYEKGIDTLINLGVKRILTSGLARNVDLGMSILQKMNSYADGRIEIMPGGGVNTNNIRKIRDEISPVAVHFSGTVPKVIDEGSKFSESMLEVDRKKVERLIEAAKQ